METLKKILNRENITSPGELREYIARHYLNQQDMPFIIYRSTDLKLDSEYRIYDEDIKYERAIFDVTCLRISNTRKISFKDCIFMGDLIISSVNLSDVSLDYCLNVGLLTIVGLESAKSVTLESVNCPHILLRFSTIHKLNIGSCYVGCLEMTECKLDDLYTFGNKIDRLDVWENDFKKVSFSHSQIPIYQQPASYDDSHLNNIVSNFDVLKFVPSPDLDVLSGREKQFRNLLGSGLYS